jgi:DNA mismatch repair ATPase MutS
MKAFLMYRDRDFDIQQKLSSQEQALTQDLELNTLFSTMARGDKLLYELAKKAVLSGCSEQELDVILYRQNVLKDCLKQASVVRTLYAVTVAAIEGEKGHYLGLLSRYPDAVLRRSITVMEMFVEMLKRLRRLADEHAEDFVSEGFTRLFTMLQQELSDDYFAEVERHLKHLRFRNGVLISAELGQGNKGTNYTLRQPHEKGQNWIGRILAETLSSHALLSSSTISISDRDESGARALSELRERGINLVANALAHSADHILSFFTMMRTELAFYIGCLNLHERLTRQGEPTTFPLPVASSERRHTFQGLYDVCLALTLEQRVVGNEVQADGKDLVIITGANQGGKSTFLRSIGLAQVMMQCGMFVPAESFCANVCAGLFTHYKRKEDTTMTSGKLDEELSRMSEMVNHLSSHAMVVLNESFAATNEREGSEIARQIVKALLEKRIKVFFVTHFYEFAHGFYDEHLENALFLRADRQPDGRRTFKLLEGEPLQTSYGEDLYEKIF